MRCVSVNRLLVSRVVSRYWQLRDQLFLIPEQQPTGDTLERDSDSGPNQLLLPPSGSMAVSSLHTSSFQTAYTHTMRSEHEQRVIVLPKGLFPHVSCRIQRLTLQQYVKFQFNAQHDCYSGECVPSGHCFQHQGHEVTEHIVPVLVHADDAHFVINLHACSA